MGTTSRHKKAAENVGKCRTDAEALEKAGYSESYARSGRIKRTKGWQELMEEVLPDEMLLKVHTEGLRATRLENKTIVADHATRFKYLDSAHKLKGHYAEGKHPAPFKPYVLTEEEKAHMKYILSGDE